MTTSNEETHGQLQRFHGDTEYFGAHYQELLDQYPEQWVAVYNQAVVGSNTDFDTLLDDLEEKAVPLESVLIEHLSREEETWILAA